MKAGLSRHYYDVYCLSQSEIFERAMESMDLLRRVAEHKSVFFKAAWAKYHTARPGTLRLLPHEAIVDALIRDYQAMGEIFYREPPPFTDILSSLPDLERLINGRQS